MKIEGFLGNVKRFDIIKGISDYVMTLLISLIIDSLRFQFLEKALSVGII